VTTAAAAGAQVPHLSGRAAFLANLKRRGLLGSLRMLAAALVDRGRAALGLSPAYVRLAGPLNSLSLMQLSSEEFQAYIRKHPKQLLVRPEPSGIQWLWRSARGTAARTAEL
jgi:hypothetical protein